ncbi:rhodanese-like domain-containing protein [Natrialbaceae archaeon AArc-T1-2]|uniref:rhodanese-like domain-containing protein n=1 Tax=Natrialbaceae archaeon AArc-T1-2 TaxID=3053904 RepID=UPI00255AEA7A|nr:rhodanese-like domain-containing protein [Natrialbaceae archaeon AArc-T1-2]WIV68282.1 rhodanese-like domain-containing protein [Natrialbaceae archaeon AArc-T1-2]
MDGEISTDEVHELLEADEDVCIVDIRDEQSFERGRIPDSENVPFDELPDRVEGLAGADRIVTVCPHGKSSIQAARLIASYEGTANARVESMAGGLTEWADSYDLEGDAGESETPF